jgi:hypothetical protein
MSTAVTDALRTTPTFTKILCQSFVLAQIDGRNSRTPWLPRDMRLGEQKQNDQSAMVNPSRIAPPSSGSSENFGMTNTVQNKLRSHKKPILYRP